MKVNFKNTKIKSTDTLVFNKPSKVYIPLISGGDSNITPLVKKGQYVYKGSIVAKRKGDFRIPIHSSVSGTVLGFIEKTNYDGKKIKCIIIENDFKEQTLYTGGIKEINKYTKDDFIKNIKDNGIVGLGGAGFPTYLKYQNNSKILIVNLAECEPYLSCDYYISKTHPEEILEAIDAILEINKMDIAIIAIKKEYKDLKEVFDNYIGTYLKIKIKIVPDNYPIGWERLLVSKITSKQYSKLPIEKGIIVNNVKTIYAIYESLKYNKPLMEKVVTFCLNDKKINVLCKIGTPIIDILEKLKYTKGNIILNGPLTGCLGDTDAIISASINGVIVKEILSDEASTCIKCGKCVSVCPAKLSPVLIMNEQNKKNLAKLHPELCVNCGLCSYICPAKIDLRKIVNSKGEINASIYKK